AIDDREARREVLAPPRIWSFARGFQDEPRSAVGAVDHFKRSSHLASAVRHDAHVACEELCHRIEITRLSCRHECGQELRMFPIDLARPRRRHGCATRSLRAYVRAGAGGKLPARSLASL